MCGRREVHTAAQIVASPSLSLLLEATGWRQFFTGPVVCGECAQNSETAVRLTRIVKSAVNALPLNSELLANGEARRYRYYSDQEILEAMRTHPNHTEAARSLGMSYAQYFKRKKRLTNEKVPEVPAVGRIAGVNGDDAGLPDNTRLGTD